MSAGFRLGVVVLAAVLHRGWDGQNCSPWGRDDRARPSDCAMAAPGAERIVVVCAEGDATLGAELVACGSSGRPGVIGRSGACSVLSNALPGGRDGGGAQPQGDHAGRSTPFESGDFERTAGFRQRPGESICQPLWQGRRRHPVVLPAIAFSGLGRRRSSTSRAFSNQCRRIGLFVRSTTWARNRYRLSRRLRAGFALLASPECRSAGVRAASFGRPARLGNADAVQTRSRDGCATHRKMRPAGFQLSRIAFRGKVQRE